MKNFHEYPHDDFQRVMDINVVGSFNVLQSVANSMRTTGGGSVVNTASVAALRGTPTMPAYVVEKRCEGSLPCAHAVLLCGAC
jgi:NAD(P)-dependent dehydrogenase (short-subunit alcohol dehydrogenase family)